MPAKQVPENKIQKLKKDGRSISGRYEVKITGFVKYTATVNIKHTDEGISATSPDSNFGLIQFELKGNTLKFRFATSRNMSNAKVNIRSGGHMTGEWGGEGWGHGTIKLTKVR